MKLTIVYNIYNKITSSLKTSHQEQKALCCDFFVGKTLHRRAGLLFGSLLFKVSWSQQSWLEK